jgi:hypothetical protein
MDRRYTIHEYNDADTITDNTNMCEFMRLFYGTCTPHQNFYRLLHNILQHDLMTIRSLSRFMFHQSQIIL